MNRQKISRWIEDHELFIFLLLGLTVLRIPNLWEPYWYEDEAIYLTIGQAMRRGVVLYAQIVDHKTPLMYFWAMLAGDLVWFKLLLMIAATISLILFYRITRSFFKSMTARLGATLVFGLVTTLPLLEGNIVNGEMMMMPFILMAVYLFWSAKDFPRQITFFRSVIIGSCLALATLTKIPALLDVATIVLSGYLILIKRRSFVWGLSLGLAGPILICLAFLGWQGNLPAFIQNGIIYNFTYLNYGPGMGHLPNFIIIASLVGRLAILMVGVWGLYLGRRRLGWPLFYNLLWLTATIFAALISLRPYPHYLIQIVPAVSLLIGFLIAEPKYRRLVGVILVGVTALLFGFGFRTRSTLGYYFNYLNYLTGRTSETDYRNAFDPRVQVTYPLAAYLSNYTNPKDKVFLWGDDPMVYALSNRQPVGRFTTSFHITSFAAFQETAKVLQTEPPLYIADTIANPATFPAFYSILMQAYLPVFKTGSATIYRHLPASLSKM